MFLDTLFPGDPDRYNNASSDLRDKYTTTAPPRYDHYRAPSAEEEDSFSDPPGLLWPQFPGWVSYHLFVTKQGPDDRSTDGLALATCAASEYWYYRGDLEDAGIESEGRRKQGPAGRTWIIYITSLHCYVTDTDMLIHTRRHLMDTLITLIRRCSEFSSVRKALASALMDPYWNKMKHSELWQAGRSMRQQLEDLYARRLPLALHYAKELQVLHAYEQVGLPPYHFVPLEPRLPEISFSSIQEVKRTRESANLDVETHTYDMAFPPPGQLPNKSTVRGSDEMSIWIMLVTRLVATAPFPAEPGTANVVEQARGLVSQLRSCSNPITGALTQWAPLSLVNVYFGIPPQPRR